MMAPFSHDGALMDIHQCRVTAGNGLQGQFVHESEIVLCTRHIAPTHDGSLIGGRQGQKTIALHVSIVVKRIDDIQIRIVS